MPAPIATRLVKSRSTGSRTRLREVWSWRPSWYFGGQFGRWLWGFPLFRWMVYATVPWLLLTRSLGTALLLGGVSLACRFEVWVRWRRRDGVAAELSRGAAVLEIRRLTTLNRRWADTCEAAGLTSHGSGSPLRLKKLKPTGDGGWWAVVAPGRAYITIEKLQKSTRTLTEFTGCKEIVVKEIGSGVAEIRFYWKNALGRLTTLAELPRAPKGHFSYGVQGDKSPATLEYKLSVLVGGLTRQGKSNWAWAALASLLRDGIPVALYISDTKEVEFEALQRLERDSDGLLTVRAYVRTVAETEKMLAAVEKAMGARQQWMRDQGMRELLVPTRENPLVVVILDEALDHSAVLKKGHEGPIGRIGRKGSASLYVMWALAQDGRVEALGMIRELLPQRLCFRVRTPQAADAVLGQGAVGIGAECHRIEDVGVGYALSNHQATPIAFRVPLVTQTQVESVARGRVPKGMLSPTEAEPDAAVYVFRNVDRTVTYVGKSVDPERRIAEHQRDSLWYAEDVDESLTKIKWCGSVTAALQQEEILIGIYEPKNNHHHNPSSYRKVMNRLPGRHRDLAEVEAAA